MNDTPIDLDFDFEGFSRRLAEAMAPEKVTAFAARVGVPQGTVSKYLRAGGSAGPRIDIVAKLADGLGCSIDWLVSGRGDGPDTESLFVKIPRYDATLAAGAGSWNEGRRKLDDIPFTREFLLKKLNRSSTAGLAVLESRGDSMVPTIMDGALMLVDEMDTRVTDGVFAFVLDEDARVKRLRKLTDGLSLISDNPAYPPETLIGDEQSRVQVIGKILLVSQLLR
jgi:transcriptional regulator with XRE-family HTH domain